MGPNQMHFAGRVLSLSVVAILAACCETTSGEASGLERMSLDSPKLMDFCLHRLQPNDAPENQIADRHIFEKMPNYFNSGAGYNYEIVGKTHNAPGSPVPIDKGDKFELAYDSAGKRFNLTHSNGTSGQTHTAMLTPYPAPNPQNDMPLIWASGRAMDENGKDLGGEYYVYALAETRSCQHSKNPGNVCKSVRFEFFMDQHDETHKPSYPGVVTEYASGGGCRNKQTSEGDGDHGPNAR